MNKFISAKSAIELTLTNRFFVFQNVKNENTKNDYKAVVFYDDYAQSFVLVTNPDDSKFLRTAQRVIGSAAHRFSLTINKDGARIPACDLPPGLFEARMCKLELEAIKNALDHFYAAWPDMTGWPDCTMPLRPVETEEVD